MAKSSQMLKVLSSIKSTDNNEQDLQEDTDDSSVLEGSSLISVGEINGKQSISYWIEEVEKCSMEENHFDSKKGATSTKEVLPVSSTVDDEQFLSSATRRLLSRRSQLEDQISFRRLSLERNRSISSEQKKPPSSTMRPPIKTSKSWPRLQNFPILLNKSTAKDFASADFTNRMSSPTETNRSCPGKETSPSSSQSVRKRSDSRPTTASMSDTLITGSQKRIWSAKDYDITADKCSSAGSRRLSLPVPPPSRNKETIRFQRKMSATVRGNTSQKNTASEEEGKVRSKQVKKKMSISCTQNLKMRSSPEAPNNVEELRRHSIPLNKATSKTDLDRINAMYREQFLVNFRPSWTEESNS